MIMENVADAIKNRRVEGHPCYAPLCPETSTYAFVIAALCRIGGRWKHPGDWLDVCDEHARQVYAARDADTYSQLPAWLRPYPEDDAPVGRPPAGRWMGLL